MNVGVSEIWLFPRILLSLVIDQNSVPDTSHLGDQINRAPEPPPLTDNRLLDGNHPDDAFM